MIGQVDSFERTLNERWAFVTTMEEEAKSTTDIHVVDLQLGVVHRKITLNGRIRDREWDSPGLRLAVILADPRHEDTACIVILDTTKADFDQCTVFSEAGNRPIMKRWPWSPDSSSIAFVAAASPPAGKRHRFVHARITDQKVDLETTELTSLEAASSAVIDWTNILQPVLRAARPGE